MSLKKSTGHMYPWVTHTHSHLGGECPHRCSYCYVDNPRFGRPAKYTGALRLIEEEFKVKYGKGKTIFVENCNDLFAHEVPSEFIWNVLAHCNQWPENVYVFQTKNPGRYAVYHGAFPLSCIFGTTIETNRPYAIQSVSRAPHPADRVLAMAAIKGRKFVTLEPILDFDVDVLAYWLQAIRPEFVNIGADSKKHGLPEPSPEKVRALLARLSEYGIEVREKHNLGRLLR